MSLYLLYSSSLQNGPYFDSGGRKGSDWPGETDLDHIHHGISMLTAEVDEPPLHEKPSTPQFSELVDIHDERYYASCHHPTRHHHQHESPVIPPPFLVRSRFIRELSVRAPLSTSPPLSPSLSHWGSMP
ncbi:hypothetical protein WG66_011391 [Moniliophthora roreri]|nr:hypothetical protein WG66_011391 [Moniliophthora roreri]